MDKRTIFSQYEIKTLLDIIKKYDSIIECKKTDAISNECKKQAWDKVCAQFNLASFVIKRSVQQLKDKYKNHKKLSQQRKEADKDEHFKIGETRNQNVDQTVCDIRIKAEPLTSPYDSDFNNEATSALQESSTPTAEVSERNGNIIGTITPEPHLSTKKEITETVIATPELRKTPVLKNTRVHRRRPGVVRKASASVVAEKHISAGAKARKRALEEEHEVNISLKKELHTAILENLRKKDKRKEEEHIAKMENLERENERNQLEHELRVETIKSEMNAKITYYEYLKKQ